MVDNINNNDTNITFFFDEINENEINKDENNDFDIYLLLQNVDNTLIHNSDIFISNIINYRVNFTVKELITICDFYGIAKEIKINKCKKEEIILFLVQFEEEESNIEIVNKRKLMWYYINELKKNTFMKKFILW
jgi:hypothetical protein